MKNIIAVLFLQVITFSYVFAQSEFDYFNIYENPVFKPDSIAKKNKIESITEYGSSLSETKKKLSFKKYRNGFLIEYQKFFLKHKFFFLAKISKHSLGSFIVEYVTEKIDYLQDSLFFNQQFGGFVSQEYYQRINNLNFTINYDRVGDSVFNPTYFFHGAMFEEPQSLNDYDSPYFKNLLIKNKVRNTLNRNDTLITTDTLLVDGSTCFTFRYNTIYSEPIKEDMTCYKGDTISVRNRIIRKYDTAKHLIYYAEYGNYNGKELMLVKSKKTEYRSDGGYTVYEDKFMADGKPDIIERYNKNNLMISYKRCFSEGGSNEIKLTYNETGLLLRSTQYLDGDYTGKTDYVYTFYK